MLVVVWGGRLWYCLLVALNLLIYGRLLTQCQEQLISEPCWS